MTSAQRRDEHGSNHSDKPANCDGTAGCGVTAPPMNHLTPEQAEMVKKDNGGVLPPNTDVIAPGSAGWSTSDPAQALEQRYIQMMTDSPGTSGGLASIGAFGRAAGMTAPGGSSVAAASIQNEAVQAAGDGFPSLTPAQKAQIFVDASKKADAMKHPAAQAAGTSAGIIFQFARPAGALVQGAKILTGEPVSVATGEYVEQWRDFEIDGPLALLGLRYMGLKSALPDLAPQPIGRCQLSMFDEFVCNPRPGDLIFYQADGLQIQFKRPFNFLASHNASYPHLDLRVPWLKQLELRDRQIIKHFKQYDDHIYRLEKIVDLNGNALLFRRNSSGWLERVEAPNGLALAFSNDARGRRTRVVLIGIGASRLELTRYAYDARDRMVAADCAFGMSVRYDWHPERTLLMRWHNPTRQSETSFAYDPEGRVVCTRTNGIWNDDEYRYDPTNRQTTYLPSGDAHRAQWFRYDANDNVTHEIDAFGHVLERKFDAAGFEISATDANGHTTTKVYDGRGNLRQVVDAEGRSTVYAWGPYGNLDAAIDGAGKIRRYENDARGNTVREIDAEGHETKFVRDDRGRLLRTVFPDQAEESQSYDARGRLESITDARGGTTRFAHDPFGRVIERIDALGHVTRYEYEAGAGGFSTPTAMIRHDGVRIQRTFGADGMLASVIDGEGRRWSYTYGAFDVLLSIEDPTGGCLRFAYDSEGRVVGVTNQKGLTYHLLRDAAGRVIAEEEFDGRRTSYLRDPGGRVIEKTKPDGARLAYTYDRTDKLTSVKSFAADAASADPPLDETYFWYDRRGLMVRASNKAAHVALERDGNGRIVRETVNGRSVESRLDARGNRVERRIGDRLVSVVRDPLGMVAAITFDQHEPLNFARDALGRETQRRSDRGFRLDQSWDEASQLSMQSVRAAASAGAGVQAQRRYSWDKAGAPVSIDDTIWGKTSFSYRPDGQVGEADFGDGFVERFDYDASRNVAGIAASGADGQSGFGDLLAWRSTPGGVVQLARGSRGEMIALTHDACGRVVARRIDRKGFRPRTWRYRWDAHDRLVACETPDGDCWHFGYDPFGRRLTKVRRFRDVELAWTAQKFPELVSAGEREKTKLWTWPTPPNGAGAAEQRPPIVGVHFTWDGDSVAEHAPLRLDGSVDWENSTRWHFEPQGFRPLAKQTADGALLLIVNDHLGTPREMFGESGDLCWSSQLSTWGRVLHSPRRSGKSRAGAALYARPARKGNSAATDDDEEEQCPLRFQGQWFDKESDLCYSRYRNYDPLAAQFVSPDPLGLAGGDRPQGYVPTPTTAVDPLGLSAAKALATNADEAVFWSGKSATAGGGIAGGAADAAKVAGSDGTTLEMLMAKKGLKLPKWDPKDPISIKAWNEASRMFAQGAKGKVRAVIGSNLRPGNVWQGIELPTLMSNPAVTSIEQIDPATGASSIIFQR